MEEILDQTEKAFDGKHEYSFVSAGFFIWCGLIALGFFLFVSNTPGGAIFLIIGNSGLFAYSLHGVARTKWRNTLTTIVFILSLTLFLLLVFSAVFLDYPFNVWAILVYLIFFLIFLGSIHLILKGKDGKAKERADKRLLAEKLKQSPHRGRNDRPR